MADFLKFVPQCLVINVILEERFQAELQLALDMSRVEQEPLQEQSQTAAARSREQFSLVPAGGLVSADDSLRDEQTEVLQLSTMETNTMATSNAVSRYPRGNYGNTVLVNNDQTFNEDYLELIGEHRKSPVFV